jgi:predicted PurR-regulated permease PerM
VQNEHVRFFVRLTKMLLVVIFIYFVMKLKALWLPLLQMLLKALTPFVIASFITYLLHPLVEKIHEKGMPRALAILMIYVIFFGGVGYGLYKGIPVFIQQLQELTKSLPALIDTYEDWTKIIHDETSNWPKDVHERIEKTIIEAEALLGVWLTKVVASLKNSMNSVITFVLVPFITFYMLKDIEQIKKAFWKITPKKWQTKGMKFLNDVDESLGNYIRGQLFVCTLIGSFAALALWIAGMKYPLLLGFLIGVTNIIPYFGPIIGAIPAAILAATISVKMLIIVLIIIFSLQFLEGNILSPLIVGKSLHLHPLIIMFSLFLGGELGGIVGLIVAVPFVAVLKVAFVYAKSLYAHHSH